MMPLPVKHSYILRSSWVMSYFRNSDIFQISPPCPSESAVMMEMWEISQTSIFFSTLTSLTALEYFNIFNHHERLNSYILTYCCKIFWDDQLHQSWVKIQYLRHLCCPFRIIYISPDDGKRPSYQNMSLFAQLWHVWSWCICLLKASDLMSSYYFFL
jgi:hypothetical protein